MEKVETLTKMFEHNLYANLAVIDICKGLTDEQLAFETDGGFGAIKPTLAHLVRAEGGYIRRLSGVRLLAGRVWIRMHGAWLRFGIGRKRPGSD